MPKEALPPKLPKHMMEVIEFFQTIKTQWNVGFGGAVGLNYVSVIEVAKIHEFELTPYRMELIRYIESYYLNKKG